MLPCFPHNQTASLVLAAALLERFPKGQLIHVQASDLGFSVECILFQPLQESQLFLLEETMREIIKKNVLFESSEMERGNGVLYLKHRGQTYRAEEAQSYPFPLIPIVQMGDFIDLSSPPFHASSGELGAFKLLSLSSEKRKEGVVITIRGSAHSDKKKVKAWIKEIESKKNFTHQVIGQTLELFKLSEEGEFFWLERGESLWFLLQGMWRCWMEDQGFKVFRTEKDKEVLGEKIAFWKEEKDLVYGDEEGLLNLETPSQDLCRISCEKKEVSTHCISCLRFLRQVLNMFDFEYRLVLRIKRGKESDSPLSSALKEGVFPYLFIRDAALEVPRIEVEIADVYGRFWTGPFLQIEGKNAYQLVISYFGNVERFIALLLEKSKGLLPWQLLPEHMRILCVSDEKEQARKYAKELKVKGLRCTVQEDFSSLNDASKGAFKIGIPFVAVIGKREILSDTIALRRWDQKEERALDKDQLTREYLEEEFEN